MCEFFEQHRSGAFQKGSREQVLADSLTAEMSEHGIQLGDNIRRDVVMANCMKQSIIIKCFILAIRLLTCSISMFQSGN